MIYFGREYCSAKDHKVNRHMYIYILVYFEVNNIVYMYTYLYKHIYIELRMSDLQLGKQSKSIHHG